MVLLWSCFVTASLSYTSASFFKRLKKNKRVCVSQKKNNFPSFANIVALILIRKSQNVAGKETLFCKSKRRGFYWSHSATQGALWCHRQGNLIGFIKIIVWTIFFCNRTTSVILSGLLLGQKFQRPLDYQKKKQKNVGDPYEMAS